MRGCASSLQFSTQSKGSTFHPLKESSEALPCRSRRLSVPVSNLMFSYSVRVFPLSLTILSVVLFCCVSVLSQFLTLIWFLFHKCHCSSVFQPEITEQCTWLHICGLWHFVFCPTVQLLTHDIFHIMILYYTSNFLLHLLYFLIVSNHLSASNKMP